MAGVMVLNYFMCFDKHWPYVVGYSHFITDRELLPNWSLSAELQMEDQTGGLFFSSLVVWICCFHLFPFGVFTLFHFSHHSLSLPALLCRGLVFSSISVSSVDFSPWYFLLHRTLLLPLPSPSLCFCGVLFFLLHYPLMLPSPWLLHHLCPSLSLFPHVLWKLSPLWGCLVGDRSPSALAVPLKVTPPCRMFPELWQVAFSAVRLSSSGLLSFP